MAKNASSKKSPRPASKDAEVSKKSPENKKKWLLDNVISLGTALFLVLIIRSSVVEAFKIPSGSMIPTLFVGDHIFVNKFAYGFKLPFTDWLMDDPIEIVSREGPKRGDIIVFKWPVDVSYYYIKRVIGTPGDKVQVKGKRLFINDQPIEVKPIAEADQAKIVADLKDNEYDKTALEVHREILGANDPTIMTDKSSVLDHDWGPETVPADSYFVMGDNRDHSNDSRFWGFVHKRFIRGKALVIWLSVWLDFKTWDFTFHPKRIGTVLN